MAVEAGNVNKNINAGRLLEGKVAIVTGGGAGIGEAIAKLYAQHGASVVVTGLPGDPVEDVVRAIQERGGRAIAHIGDVATELGAGGCVQAAVDAFGKLDVLAVNHGLFVDEAFVDELPIERFDELLHSNIRGVYLTVRAALPALQETKGVIVAAGSEAGILATPKIVAYGATKAWIHQFIRGVATEQARYGVRANVVAPGPIDTEMTRPSVGAISQKNAFLATRSVAFGRRGTPEEVANVFLFLASDLASFVTGAIYSVDGGSTASQGMPGLEAKKPAKEAPEGTVDLEHQHDGRGTLT